jgi:HK97 family phage portal protein
MSFWTWLRGDGWVGITPNENGPLEYSPGDPEGLEFQGFDDHSEARSMPLTLPTPWDGWPTGWATTWQQPLSQGKLIDIAWACMDLNSSVLASMPVYRLQNGRIVSPVQWMLNPDPMVYTSWQEFAKQLFWDFQLGEAFILPINRYSDGYPQSFRVVPPWLVQVDMGPSGRLYRLGGTNGRDVTDDILHIRYSSTTAEPRGRGPLDVAGARLTAIGLLERYANRIAETGGVPQYWIGVDRVFRNKQEATDLLDQWVETRTKYAGQPAILGSGAKLNQASTMSARDMALMELSQFNESRIAVLLGVPPFLVGLAGATGSLTYSNISDLFDFHDRSSLRPKAHAAMEALSQWAFPSTTSVEINRDDYTRLPFDKRMAAYQIAIQMGILTADEVRVMERYVGEQASQALTGGIDTGTPNDLSGNAPTPPVNLTGVNNTGRGGFGGGTNG